MLVNILEAAGLIFFGFVIRPVVVDAIASTYHRFTIWRLCREKREADGWLYYPPSFSDIGTSWYVERTGPEGNCYWGMHDEYCVKHVRHAWRQGWRRRPWNDVFQSPMETAT